MRKLDKEKLKVNIQAIAAYDLDNNNLFGSSYYVWQNGSVAFKKHFGNVSFEGSANVSDDTIYRLASMTKPITAVALLILEERGQISLNDPVSKFLNEFKNIHIVDVDGTDLGVTATELSVLHCLTHTSGFGHEKNIDLTGKRHSISETLKVYIDAGLGFEPYTKQSYSPFAAFDIIAAIIEKVSGEDFGDFLKKELFDPCNMPDTTFSPSESQWQRLICMHNKVNGKSEEGLTYPGCVFERFPCEHKLAGAGLVSTLNDYSNFAKMLLNKGKINGCQILSERTISKMSVPYVPKEIMAGAQNWGLGVRVITEDSYKYLPVGSFGWSGAFGSHFWVDPENDICAVFMKNSRFDGGSGNASAARFEKAVFDSLI